MISPGTRLHFTGDSITHAHRRPEEVHDVYQLGHGWVCRLAGLLTCRRPQDRLTFGNSGECGHSVHHLLARWGRDIIDQRPDLLTILIGVNDAGPAQFAVHGAEGYVRRYLELLALTRRLLPSIRLVVVEPFILPFVHEGNPHAQYLAEPARPANTRMLAAACRTLVAPHADVFVPLQERFDALAAAAPPMHYAVDGIHPTAAGHEVIAQAWLAAIDGGST